MQSELLVPLDGSPLADAAVPHAMELARRTGATVTLLHVLPEGASGQEDWIVRRARILRANSDVPVRGEVRTGAPADVIVAFARARGVRLIVCSTHGSSGWAPRWIGSVADAVIRRAPCPVLALSEAAAARPPGARQLLVLLDGSDASDAVLPDVVWLARTLDADVELFQVVAPSWLGDLVFRSAKDAPRDRFDVDTLALHAKHSLDRVAARLRKDGLVVQSSVCIHLSPARAILDRIDESDPDVVALATVGRGASRLLLGSVAEKVLSAGGRPMFLVRTEQFVAREFDKLRANADGLAQAQPAD